MICEEEWNRLLSLAKLSVSEEEKTALRTDLEAMVAFAQKMGELPSAKPEDEAAASKGGSSAALREDSLQPSQDRIRILQNAPFAENGFFLTRGNF